MQVTLPKASPATIPDDWTVWAATDLHGQLDATRAALFEARLVDDAGRWIAPAGTAFVVCGDIVDRGPDSLGLLRYLVGLREEAAVAGSAVALLEGNHELQTRLAIEGDPLVAEAWMVFGAPALLVSAGIAEGAFSYDDPLDAARQLAAAAPDIATEIRALAPYARWRDVLLVHGGPVPGVASLEDYAASVERLWIRAAFFDAPEPFPDHPVWLRYRDAGIGRVVFGHTPVAAPTAYHGGRALNIDTWKGGLVTLARLEPDGVPLAGQFVSAPVAPRLPEARPAAADAGPRWDAILPPHIDRLRATVGAAATTS